MPKLRFIFCLFFAGILNLLFVVPVYAADSTPPSSTFSINPSTPNGENGWFITKPEITISSTDDVSGVKEIYYRINSDPWVQIQSFSGTNLVLNPSFENGYISDWEFVGPFLSVGYKSSLFQRTGSYSAGIISLSPFFDSYFVNSLPIIGTANKEYNFSLYHRSITSFLDNAFVQIISKSGSTSKILYQINGIDLKFNYQNASGTFTTDSTPSPQLYIRIGLRELGHLSIEDVFIAPSGGTPKVNFVLDREGVNTIQFYAVDFAGNVETTKQVVIKLDTFNPIFSNFRVNSQDNIKKFSSSISIADSTSGLVSSPVLFNYSVDGINDGYFEDYQNCSGSFLEDAFLTPSVNFSTGANNGVITTPTIDYCDSNWVNCKKLNFYAKDIAGNIANHVICVNGPYITSSFGNTFGRTSINQMGIGADYNIWGLAVSAGVIDDVSLFSDLKTAFYTNSNYLLNDFYQIFLKKYDSTSSVVTQIPNQSGIYKIEDDYQISDPLTYSNVSQVVFINGDLQISSNITSTDSSVIYLVNGNITIDNECTNADVGLVATNQIYTATNFDLAQKLTIKGFLVGRNIVFNRNTDRTLGASEVIIFPINSFFNKSFLSDNPIYRAEDRDE